MKQLIFLVEGKSEVIFVERYLIPYLYQQKEALQAVPMRAQTIRTNRKQHKKGGAPNYPKVKNELKILLKDPQRIVTTLLDFYALPTDFPNHTTDKANVQQIEDGMLQDFPTNNFMPFIQVYELEALMFADLNWTNLYEEEEQTALQAISEQFSNPETINHNQPPSKRLDELIAYKKVADTDLIFSEINLDNVRKKCPRFNQWISTLLQFNDT